MIRLFFSLLLLLTVVGTPLLSYAASSIAMDGVIAQGGGTTGGNQGGGGTTGNTQGGGGTTGGNQGGGGTTGGGGGLTNPLNSIDSLPALLDMVLKAVVQIGTILLTLALVYVGFLFVMAQGNEEKISNAKNALLWTIIGGLILLGASAIGAVIGSTVDKL